MDWEARVSFLCVAFNLVMVVLFWLLPFVEPRWAITATIHSLVFMYSLGVSLLVSIMGMVAGFVGLMLKGRRKTTVLAGIAANAAYIGLYFAAFNWIAATA